jgi:amino acid transporter
MCFNLALVFFIVVVGSSQVQPAHWSPFAPSGMRGIVDNAGFVFFSYIGFDCVCTLAEELEHPQRDLPRGIVWTLVIVTTLYVLVSLVLTGKRMFVYTCSNYVIVILIYTDSYSFVLVCTPSYSFILIHTYSYS